MVIPPPHPQDARDALAQGHTGLPNNAVPRYAGLRRNEEHDSFINSVTHELKTPIASIRLYLEVRLGREPRSV